MTYLYNTEYCGQDIIIEYEVEEWGSSTTYSPAYGAEGGDPMICSVGRVYDKNNELDMLFTSRQREIWEDLVASEHDSFPEDDYDDNYF